MKANFTKGELVTLSAHSADTGYMVVVDGVPVTKTAAGVQRPAGEVYYKVTTADGRVYYFRLLCGFQFDENHWSSPIKMKPRVTQCVEGARDNESRCTPTKPRTTTTPTTPTTPVCVWQDGSTHPLGPNGTCPKDSKVGTTANPNHTKAVVNPSQGADSPHADPATPATPGTQPGAGTGGQAPGATTAPTGGGTVVQDGTSPSAPAAGDGVPHT
ncbi:MAG: hypothetical protein WAQ25_03275 [Candidatus Saccharimonas sp.]